MRVRIDSRGDYLHVTADGPFDPAAARGAVVDIFAACATHGLGRVFIDARGLETRVSVAERFDLGRALAEAHRGNVSIAILVAPAQMVVKTLENSASNRGVPVRTTADVGEAYGFLGLPPPG